MIILTILTNIAYSSRDFHAAVAGPLRKRLLYDVFRQNIQDQVSDIYHYDVFKGLSFVGGQRTRSVVISDREACTTYMDLEGNAIDAAKESSSKLYGNRIDIIPNSLSNSHLNATAMNPLSDFNRTLSSNTFL